MSLYPEVEAILTVIAEDSPHLKTLVKKLRMYFEQDASQIEALQLREKHLLEFHHCNCELK